MRVFLDAYFDNNFGDDLFIDVLLKRYPKALFYTFWDDAPADVIARATRFANLVILPGSSLMKECWQFDAYVMVGGDVLPNGVDYSARIAHMKRVKESGGLVALLGFSLYVEYGEQTREDIQTMAALADIIVIRDKISAKRFESLVSQAKITESTDMAFTADYSHISSDKGNILGIVPRRKLYSTDDEYWSYCKRMANIADCYLDKNEEAKVHFFAFSTGVYDDRVVAKDIMDLMSKGACTNIIAYEGNIDLFLQEINKCNALIPTRFHGLVIALLLRIPFVPVPYEVKVTQLLDELGYDGRRIPYGINEVSENAEEVLDGLYQFNISEEYLLAYKQKAERFFEELDKWYLTENKCNENRNFFVELDKTMEGRTSLIEENRLLKLQQNELEKWIEALQAERKAFEMQNIELEGLRKVQEEQINKIPVLENENRMLQEQVNELMKWIDSLKKERAAFERQNIELDRIREWYKEKLMRKTLQPRKLEEEYNVFLQDMRKKLDG